MGKNAKKKGVEQCEWWTSPLANLTKKRAFVSGRTELKGVDQGPAGQRAWGGKVGEGSFVREKKSLGHRKGQHQCEGTYGRTK